MPAMSVEDVDNVRRIEAALLQHPQVDFKTFHVIHGGMYSRTVMVPANHIITGALIKIPTQVIVVGDAKVLVGDKVLNLSGYNVLPAQSGRKQIFRAITDIYITMVFPTKAQTVSDAENEFTDEANLLASNRDESQNIFIKTED
jgi:hypothetical protein